MEKKVKSSKKENKRVRKSRKTSKPLPDPRMSVETQIKILKAFHEASGKGEKYVSAKDVAPLAGAHETQSGGVASFFYKIGLLDRDHYKYRPKDTLVDFCNELEWSPETAGNFLKEGFKDTWFGETIKGIFNVNEKISKEDLIKNLGRVAEAEKFHKRHLNILIDFLEYSKMIKFDESSQKFISIKNLKENKNSEKPSHINEKIPKKTDPIVDSEKNRNVETKSNVGTNININLDVKFSDDTDPELLANKIKKFKELIK